jgi:hypothetical protein
MARHHVRVVSNLSTSASTTERRRDAERCVMFLSLCVLNIFVALCTDSVRTINASETRAIAAAQSRHLFLPRYQDTFRSNGKKLLLLGIARRHRDSRKATGIMSGLAECRRWRRKFGLNQKQRPSCNSFLPAKAYTTRHRASGKEYIQVIIKTIRLLPISTDG